VPPSIALQCIGSYAMTGAQYMSALESLELNQVSAAAFLQISVRTSHGYANGQRIPRAVQLLLKLMIEHEIKPETLA
jgi:hypothetical protein